jgi:hypothetical protein
MIKLGYMRNLRILFATLYNAIIFI